MTVCACPQGIIRRDCDYHQSVAQRFLETLNRPARLGEPGAKGMVVLDQRPVNVVPSPGGWDQPGADPQADLRDVVSGGYRPDSPLIAQHFASGGYTAKDHP